METKQNIPAESFKITGDWDLQAKNLKEKFSQLTDADLKFEAGKDEELLCRIEAKLKKTRQEVVSILRKGQPHTI